MSRNWTPGDTLLVNVGDEAFFDQAGLGRLMDELILWWPNRPHGLGIHGGTAMLKWIRDTVATSAPLTAAVIDPADREAVQRLVGLWDHYQAELTQGSFLGPIVRPVDAMQEALRELAKPAPSKPEEPMGLGAVVEDSEGRRWCRTISHNEAPAWLCAAKGKAPLRWWYAELDAAKVLSEGVVA